MLRNFDSTLDRQGVSISRRVIGIEETVKVVSKPKLPLSKRYTFTNDADWDWRDLRDFVVAHSRENGGRIIGGPRLVGIFEGFMKRWGDAAVQIARYAIEVEGGVWLGHLVTPEDFAHGSDPYFAIPISERLA